MPLTIVETGAANSFAQSDKVFCKLCFSDQSSYTCYRAHDTKSKPQFHSHCHCKSAAADILKPQHVICIKCLHTRRMERTRTIPCSANLVIYFRNSDRFSPQQSPRAVFQAYVYSLQTTKISPEETTPKTRSRIDPTQTRSLRQNRTFRRGSLATRSLREQEHLTRLARPAVHESASPAQ